MNHAPVPKIIKLDASKWKTGMDFYDAILPALGAPEWHGRSVDALVESMVWGEINELEPPYTVELHATKNIPPEVMQQITWVKDFIYESRAEMRLREGHDVDVDMTIID